MVRITSTKSPGLMRPLAPMALLTWTETARMPSGIT